MYTSEKPADPIVLWINWGADKEFTLYEDDGGKVVDLRL
jgi:hypothetical protein